MAEVYVLPYLSQQLLCALFGSPCLYPVSWHLGHPGHLRGYTSSLPLRSSGCPGVGTVVGRYESFGRTLLGRWLDEDEEGGGGPVGGVYTDGEVSGGDSGAALDECLECRE